jgi:hypothetical protein
VFERGLENINEVTQGDTNVQGNRDVFHHTRDARANANPDPCSKTIAPGWAGA